MTQLTFELPDGTTREVTVRLLLNAGYAGRRQDVVAAHVAELAALGVPSPSVTPALYPVSPYLAQQTTEVTAQHPHTSGEAEWALVVADGGELLLTAACDHTDRDLEVHGVAWSKNAGPDVLARQAWRLDDVSARLDQLTLCAWVTHHGAETRIQHGTLADLLTPAYWTDVLRTRGGSHDTQQYHQDRELAWQPDRIGLIARCLQLNPSQGRPATSARIGN